jgi:hypothetical protein
VFASEDRRTELESYVEIFFVSMLATLFFATIAVFQLPERRLRASSKIQWDAAIDGTKTA